MLRGLVQPKNEVQKIGYESPQILIHVVVQFHYLRGLRKSELSDGDLLRLQTGTPRFLFLALTDAQKRVPSLPHFGLFLGLRLVFLLIPKLQKLVDDISPEPF